MHGSLILHTHTHACIHHIEIPTFQSVSPFPKITQAPGCLCLSLSLSLSLFPQEHTTVAKERQSDCSILPLKEKDEPDHLPDGTESSLAAGSGPDYVAAACFKPG